MKNLVPWSSTEQKLALDVIFEMDLEVYERTKDTPKGKIAHPRGKPLRDWYSNCLPSDVASQYLESMYEHIAKEKVLKLTEQELLTGNLPNFTHWWYENRKRAKQTEDGEK